MFSIDAGKIAAALKPYGPTPIVCVATGLGAFAALAVGANETAVVIIAILVLGVHIYGQERRGSLRKRDLEIDFDAKLREQGQIIVERLEVRLQRRRQKQAPSLFDGDTP